MVTLIRTLAARQRDTRNRESAEVPIFACVSCYTAAHMRIIRFVTTPENNNDKYIRVCPLRGEFITMLLAKHNALN